MWSIVWYIRLGSVDFALCRMYIFFGQIDHRMFIFKGYSCHRLGWTRSCHWCISFRSQLARDVYLLGHSCHRLYIFCCWYKTSRHITSFQKRPTTKLPPPQNIQSTKRPSLQNVLPTTCPHLQNVQPIKCLMQKNVLLYVTPSPTKRPSLQNVPLLHFLCTIYIK